MAPDIKAEEIMIDENGHPANADTAAAEAALKAKLSRKRTKTGCLTCRKRRIKCGEERPVCKNCIKSKRHCEGYNQRVVFKPPTFDYQPVANGGAHITFQAGPVQMPAAPLQEIHPPIYDPSLYAQPLRPRPYQDHEYAPAYHGQNFEQIQPQFAPKSVPATPIDPGQQQAYFPQQHIQNQNQDVFNPQQHQTLVQQMVHHVSPGMQFANGQQHIEAIPQAFHQQIPPPGNGMPPVTVPPEYLAQAYGQGTVQSLQHLPVRTLQPTTQTWEDMKPVMHVNNELANGTPASSHSSKTFSFSQTPTMATQQQWTANVYAPRPELTQPLDYQDPASQTYHPQSQPQPSAQSATLSPTHSLTPQYYEYEEHPPPHLTPTHLLNSAAVEAQDDDYYDVGSDDEMDIYISTTHPDDQARQRALSRILALNQANSHDLQMRRYDTFIYDGILDHYKVEDVASPLRNPATARVFAHFISATGPSLSIFERHPRNTSVLFAEGQVPFSQQGLWTYTMPMAALRNQGLLHAMLALASLHIARLQNASVTPSMQHYAWALKRIHSSVADHHHNGRRLKITTIAASMLLGFYEVMTADHMKWNMHLTGSKQLFVETDFAKMTQEFRRLKSERAARLQFQRDSRLGSEEPSLQDDLLDQIPDVDESILSHFTGREIRYDNHGRVESAQNGIPSGLDLSKFEILKDLYWWFCKQDVYQSIVSGNPLLMDFSRWGNCPPRAPLGKVDAVYGTFDHLVLLLGRVADFASKDRKRKLKQMEVNGGQWRPAPGMNIPRPPQQHAPPPTPVSATNSFPMPGTFMPAPMASPGEQPANGMPQFFGMAPPPRANVQMPSSYTPYYTIPTPQSAHPADTFDYDLETATHHAMEEYGRIRAALRTFATSLGPAFEPLPPEYQTPMETSFGSARFYRSYDIGCMWAIYNMAEIIAIRSHPHMPPAAHAAAGIAAQQTAPFAIEIGRIAAGIVPGPPEQPLNPGLGAALCESCMPSFFAAIQYQDSRQRYDTVTRIFSIATRTGWGSAELIANGCETAWVKAAAAGRGPPYQRIMRRQDYTEDPRLNGSWEQLDPNSSPEEGNDSDRRLIKNKSTARLNWAIGVMGVEDDVHKIEINE